MWKVFRGKILFGALTIAATMVIATCLMHVLPGDPFLDEQGLDDKIHATLLEYYGLNLPLLHQTWNHFSNLCRLDLGCSLVYRERQISTIIAETFPISATLGAAAGSIAIVGGLLWGIASYLSGIRLGLSSLALAIPSFILAALLQYLFAVEWKLLPIARWGTLSQAILPAIALAARPMAFIAKMIKNNLAESDELNFIITARTRRLSAFRILFCHQLPYALLPLIGYLSQMVATILVGSFVIEKIFSIPGMGFWFVNGVLNRDYPLILGTTIFFNFLLVAINLLGDAITLAMDPRQREVET